MSYQSASNIKAESQQTGFTLIEMMVVVAIIGILAAIAYPSYTEYVKRGNRTEGQALLSDAAARQERYFSQNNAYVTDNNNIARLGLALRPGNKSATDKYVLSLSSVANDGGYTLTATQQFSDTKCGNLGLNAAGVRTVSASGASVADCWR